MQALHDIVKAGWVRYIGMSSCYAYQCESIVSWSATTCSSLSSPRHAELRHQEQPHAFHLDAEPLQSSVPRGRARDDAYAQCMNRAIARDVKFAYRAFFL